MKTALFLAVLFLLALNWWCVTEVGLWLGPKLHPVTVNLGLVRV